MLSSMGRPRQHDETTAEALLDAAEHQLRAGGLDGVSLRSIANEAGVSIRAIYSLFENKDGLIDALAIRAFGRLRQSVGDVPITEEPVEDLVRAGQAFFRLASDNPESYRLAWERVFTTDLTAKPAWADEALHARNALRTRIGRAFGDDDRSGLDSRRLTAAFHAICQGFASCHVNQVFDGMRVTDTEELLATTLRNWIEAANRPAVGRNRTGSSSAGR